MSIDAIDRQIIQATQCGLPLVSEPYHAIAQQLRLPVETVMQRMQQMLDSGIIRRIGAVPNHYKLGYRHNGMTVWDIDDECVFELGRRVAALSFVSHCYQRPRHLPDWPYNLFAMVHGKTAADAEQQVQTIATLLGDAVRSHDVLYSSRILKKTGLRIGD